MKLEFALEIFKKSSDIKLNENPSSRSYSMQVERHNKPIVAFHNF